MPDRLIQASVLLFSTSFKQHCLMATTENAE